jgi:hypothetical protein
VPNVGIGTATPHVSALLDVTSATKGVLIPRMTIATPAAGLQVYNTDTNQLNFHNGTSWGAITGTAGATGACTISCVVP